ncbi:DUF1883 domain-containing protein [Crocosphaera sp.]|uniref:DUF1883 domain-containing protein n=1 Tax=Crocosphaera sp. TaxID=2729996 RepID=UPI003F2571B3|nr:DUF1883 domain-containing protein [Crocosphaera sp.]
MNFTHYKLGQCERGERVQVTLSGNAANVRLMDNSNFQNYKNGRKHRYVGGLAKKSPINLEIPSSGTWHVAVDLQGLGGNVKSSIKMLPKPLPTIKETPLSSIPSLVQRDFPNISDDNQRQYDVFISHASEDKEDIVRELAKALKNEGLQVWYDEFELKIGDSLRRKIDRGLARSRVGLVIPSPSFIRKGWTNYELDGIITRTVTGEQILLPIWHKISKREVIEFSPSIADKVARNTANHTVEEIATKISNLLRN